MKLTICFIISAILFTPILGWPWITAFHHYIPYREGPGSLVTHLEISFDNFGCNVANLPATTTNDLLRQLGKRDVRLGSWVRAHSMVYFRGKTYEFTTDNVRHYGGGIGRYNTLACPVKRSDAGHSICTSSQATALAKSYHDTHTYSLLTDNCHYFAEWLINRLLNNECTTETTNAEVIALG